MSLHTFKQRLKAYLFAAQTLSGAFAVFLRVRRHYVRLIYMYFQLQRLVGWVCQSSAKLAIGTALEYTLATGSDDDFNSPVKCATKLLQPFEPYVPRPSAPSPKPSILDMLHIVIYLSKFTRKKLVPSAEGILLGVWTSKTLRMPYLLHESPFNFQW